MAGTHTGGLKSAAKNRRLYGHNFYEMIGRKGGKISRGGGFTGDRERARRLGRLGGLGKKEGHKLVHKIPVTVGVSEGFLFCDGNHSVIYANARKEAGYTNLLAVIIAGVVITAITSLIWLYYIAQA